MTADLDHLKDELSKNLEARGFVVFRGVPRRDTRSLPVLWDSEAYPNPFDFLDVAAKLSVKLIVFHHDTFNTVMIGQSFEKLEEAGLDRDEHRDIERRLRKLKTYEGFTSIIDLSFDVDGKTYAFVLFAPWYSEYLEILDRLDEAFDDEDPFGDDEDEGPTPGLGGYFSKN